MDAPFIVSLGALPFETNNVHLYPNIRSIQYNYESYDVCEGTVQIWDAKGQRLRAFVSPDDSYTESFEVESTGIYEPDELSEMISTVVARISKDLEEIQDRRILGIKIRSSKAIRENMLDRVSEFNSFKENLNHRS